MAFRFRSLVDAGRGRVARARGTLLPLIEEAKRSATAWWEALLLSALAFVEFAAGDHRAVDRALDAHARVPRRDRHRGDGSRPERAVPRRVARRTRRARAGAGGARAARGARPHVPTPLDHGHAAPHARLVLAGEGDVAAALAALDELDLEVASLLPLDLGWTRLVQGRLLRRARQRRAAANALQQALEIFERLGAPEWVERARAELERVGLRRAATELTATEGRVAELAASGLTNREVAAKAFMSPKTVEANLARVYRKLGIRSRAELGARIAGLSAPPAPATTHRATGKRELATILFTDLVGSTEKARSLGDAAWATLLARHNAEVRRELSRFSGEEIDTAGDGFLAVFDGPARAISCALAIRNGLRALELDVRAGVHTGEVERPPDDKPRGIAIHTCARIMSLAGAGEVLVSSTTRDLVDGSGLEFEDRGEHELRGIDGTRRVFAAG